MKKIDIRTYRQDAAKQQTRSLSQQKRLICYRYLNHATTCDQLYRYVRHLQRAHGQISTIVHDGPVSQGVYQQQIGASYALQAKRG